MSSKYTVRLSIPIRSSESLTLFKCKQQHLGLGAFDFQQAQVAYRHGKGLSEPLKSPSILTSPRRYRCLLILSTVSGESAASTFPTESFANALPATGRLFARCGNRAHTGMTSRSGA